MEEEKERALGLQRKEKELRARLLSILLSKRADDPRTHDELAAAHAGLLQPVLDILQTVSASCVGAAVLPSVVGPPPQPESSRAASGVNGRVAEEAPVTQAQEPRHAASPEKRCPAVLACIPDNQQQPAGPPAASEQSAPRKDARSEQDKCNREPSGGRGRASGERSADDGPREASRPRAGSAERGRRERRAHRKRAHEDASPRRRSGSPERSRSRRSRSGDRHGRRDRSRGRRGGSGRKRSRQRRGERSRSGSTGRHRSTWNR